MLSKVSKGFTPAEFSVAIEYSCSAQQYIPIFNPLDSPLLVRLVLSEDKDYPSEYIPTNCTDAFSLASPSLLEAIIPPNGKVELGPILFHPTEFGVCSTYIFIINNYTSVESCMFLLSLLY